MTELPFKVSQTPDVFTPFRKRIEGLPKLGRDCLATPAKFKPFPAASSSSSKKSSYAGYGEKFDDVTDPTEVIEHLLKPLQEPNAANDKTRPAGENQPSAFPFKGGETSAIERLEWYFNKGKDSPVATYKVSSISSTRQKQKRKTIDTFFFFCGTPFLSKLATDCSVTRTARNCRRSSRMAWCRLDSS